jgi:hypothetical protein
LIIQHLFSSLDKKELDEHVKSLSNKELREILQDRNIKQNDILDKSELVSRVKEILEKDLLQGNVIQHAHYSSQVQVFLSKERRDLLEKTVLTLIQSIEKF